MFWQSWSVVHMIILYIICYLYIRCLYITYDVYIQTAWQCHRPISHMVLTSLDFPSELLTSLDFPGNSVVPSLHLREGLQPSSFTGGTAGHLARRRSVETCELGSLSSETCELETCGTSTFWRVGCPQQGVLGTLSNMITRVALASFSFYPKAAN